MCRNSTLILEASLGMVSLESPVISPRSRGSPALPGQPKSKLSVLHISIPHMWTKWCVIVSRKGCWVLSTEMRWVHQEDRKQATLPENAFLKEPEQWRDAQEIRGGSRRASWRPVVWQVSACLSWLVAFSVSKFKCLHFSQFTFHFSLSHVNYGGTFKSACRWGRAGAPLVRGGIFQAWKGVWCAHLSPVTAEPECALSVCWFVSWSSRRNLTPSLWEIEQKRILDCFFLFLFFFFFFNAFLCNIVQIKNEALGSWTAGNCWKLWCYL